MTAARSLLNGRVLLHCGDALAVLRTMPSESVHCGVTSPPYWGLRCYGVDGQYGLEPTLGEHIAVMVEVFREFRRVLRKDGVLWLNYGDCYATAPNGRSAADTKAAGNDDRTFRDKPFSTVGGVLKPKDLAMVPQRLALALQEPHHYGPIRSEADRAWLAALVDGEGTISIRRHNSYSSGGNGRSPAQDGFHVFLSIGNSDRELLDRCVSITGYGSVLLKNPAGRVDPRGITTKRDNYVWRIEGNKAIPVIRDIYPYLIAKRRQAVLAYNLDVSNKAGRDLRGNGRLPESEQEKRELLKRLCNQCNQRQPVDLPSWLLTPPSNVEQGWWLRSQMPWVKRNGMPESISDRPANAIEYVFLLTRSERYWYDAEAVRRVRAQDEDANGFRGGSYVGGQPGPRAFVGNKKFRASTTGPRHNGHINHTGIEDTPRGSRNFRNTDLFFDSLSEPWGMVSDGEGLPIALDVPPRSFTDAHFACVDADTECLTPRGWKRHDDLHPGDVAAQFDIGLGRLSWAPIEDIARYEVSDQVMVAAKSRDVELLLTPNHRTIISRQHPRTRRWQDFVVIRADELKTSHAIPVSADWDENGHRPFSSDWAELLGWYLAEGCETSHSWAVEIYQSRSANPEKVARIRTLLNSVGAEFFEAAATRAWRGQPRTLVAFQVRGFAAAFLRQWAPGKRFHSDVLLWSADILARMFDGLIDGDGHRRADGRCSFIQRDRESADLAQAVGVRLGYASMLSRRSEGTFVVYFTRKRLISFRGTAGEGAEIGQRPYSGVVWCPKLPAGTWVARKSGRSFITGNTFPAQLVEPLIKAGCPKECCAQCGKPWVRIVERGAPLAEWQRACGGDAEGGYNGEATKDFASAGAQNASDVKRRILAGMTERISVGWEPQCKCGVGTVPGTVLDCFFGAGTTGMVAARLGRNAIGIELNPAYADMAANRIEEDWMGEEARGIAKAKRAGAADPGPLFGAPA